MIGADFSARLAGINVGSPAPPTPSGDFGLIGLAVMGQNLILNIADNGFTVVVFNRTVSKVDRFVDNEAKGTGFISSESSLVATDRSHRQVHHRNPFDPGILLQAQEASQNHASGHGWQGR